MDNIHHHGSSHDGNHTHHNHHRDFHSDSSLQNHAGVTEGDEQIKKSRHRIPYNELLDESIICKCTNISFRMIKDAVDNGANTPEAVAAHSGYAFKCGKCVSYMADIIAAYKNSKESDVGNS